MTSFSEICCTWIDHHVISDIERFGRYGFFIVDNDGVELEGPFMDVDSAYEAGMTHATDMAMDWWEDVKNEEYTDAENTDAGVEPVEDGFESD